MLLECCTQVEAAILLAQPLHQHLPWRLARGMQVRSHDFWVLMGHPCSVHRRYAVFVDAVWAERGIVALCMHHGRVIAACLLQLRPSRQPRCTGALDHLEALTGM